MAEEGQFVGSGSFRIDRRKAVEVLARYQLPDPGAFILPLMRSAIAGGPKQISLTLEDKSSLELSWSLHLTFDGKPFPPRILKDPYECLFSEEGGADARSRFLAVGLLSALRAAPEKIKLDSGLGDERWRLEISTLDDWQAAPAPGDGTRNALSLVWGRSPPTQTSLAACRALLLREEVFAMSPAPIHLHVEEFLRPDAGFVGYAMRAKAPEGALLFRRERGEGWLVPSLEPAGQGSALKVYHHGVYLGPEDFDLPVSASGCVNTGHLTLDAAHSAAVRDRRFEELRRLLSEQALRLLAEQIREQGEEFPQAAGHLREAYYLTLWRERDAWRSSMEDAEGWDKVKAFFHDLVYPRNLPENARHFLSAARRADWLHEAGRKVLTQPEKDAGKPLLKALWQAPMFLSANGGTLSLREVEEQKRRLGVVLYSRAVEARGSSDRVWCPSAHELGWLSGRFGASIREEA